MSHRQSKNPDPNLALRPMSGPRPYASPSCLALGPGTLGWLAGWVWLAGAGSGYGEGEGEGEGVGLYSRTIIAISGALCRSP